MSRVNRCLISDVLADYLYLTCLSAVGVGLRHVREAGPHDNGRGPRVNSKCKGALQNDVCHTLLPPDERRELRFKERTI